MDILGNPRFLVHKKPQRRSSASSPGYRTFPGGLVELLGPQAPQDPFLEEPEKRRATRGNFLTAGPRPGRMQLHPRDGVERGDWERFRVIFWGSHVRVVLIPAGRDSGTSRGLWDG